MKIKHFKYRFLSYFSFGKMRKHYKRKWKEVKNNDKNRFDIIRNLSSRLDMVITKQQEFEHILNSSIPFRLEQINKNIAVNKKMLINNRLEYFKREIIERKLFDENYYIKNYPSYKKYGMSALDHYVEIGWRLMYNPSECFNTTLYLNTNRNLDICPLFHFLSEGKDYAAYAYWSNPNSSPNYQRKSNNTKVVYTCIVGNYDNLLQHTYLDNEWDYVCFTDNIEWIEKGQIGCWQIKPLFLSIWDSTRVNRFHKINPHLFFPEYQESLYVDANVNILSPFIFDLIEHKNTDLIIPRHFVEVCAYNHAKWILHHNQKDRDKINAFLNIMKKDGFPYNYGMTENNIIYRKHHKKRNIKIMDEWWGFVRDYCKRDQLSLSYVLWKNNIEIWDISFPNARADINNFMLVSHEKKVCDVD